MNSRRTANVATNVRGRKGPSIEKVNLLYVSLSSACFFPSVRSLHALLAISLIYFLVVLVVCLVIE